MASFFGDAESDYRAAMACKVDFVGIVLGLGASLLEVAPEIMWVRDFMGMDFGQFMGRR